MFNEAPLFLAIRKNNIEIIKLLLSNDKIDTNKKTIFNINNSILFTYHLYKWYL